MWVLASILFIYLFILIYADFCVIFCMKNQNGTKDWHKWGCQSFNMKMSDDKKTQVTFWTVLLSLELFCSSQWSFSNFMLVLFIFFPVRKGRIEDLHNLLWLRSHFGCQSAVGFVPGGGQLWEGRMPTGTPSSWAELSLLFQAQGLSGVSWDNCNEIWSHIFGRWTQNGP